MNPDLAQYYEKLALITQGELWDWERLKTILWFNLGAYDHWRDAITCARRTRKLRLPPPEDAF